MTTRGVPSPSPAARGASRADRAAPGDVDRGQRGGGQSSAGQGSVGQRSTGRRSGAPGGRGSATAGRADAPRTGDDADAHLSSAPVTPRALGLLLTVGGVLGFVSAFVLSVERFRLAEDPTGYTPSCSINPYISCGSVMASRQGALFGFPNSLLGIGAFAIATTLGLLLISGVALPRWIRLGLAAGITLGAVFVVWLISQALYSIHALCPYCLVVWAIVIPMFWTITADTLDRGLVPVPAGARRAVAALVDYRLVVIIATYAVVLVLVAIAFWSYWVSLL